MSRMGSTSTYVHVAVDIARRVASREYQEGQRISGRSTLSGLYKVSPETIRKAVALLEDWGILKAQPGSGVWILSKTRVEDFLRWVDEEKGFREAIARLSRLMEERRRLDREMEQLVEKIVGFVSLHPRF